MTTSGKRTGYSEHNCRANVSDYLTTTAAGSQSRPRLCAARLWPSLPPLPHALFDTILRWYRNLIAAKYDGSKNRGKGRPPTAVDICKLIVRMAQENPTWGYTRLRGALKNLGYEVGRNTIKRVLADNGIAPAPERGKSMSWSTFIMK